MAISTTTKLVAVTAATLLTAGAGYALYFDHRRRTDPDFRRQLRKGRVAAEKKRAREEKSQQDELKKKYKKAWMEIKDFKYPTKPEEMEQFFLNNITEAETLHAQVPPALVPAAQSFYKALKVYPNPPDLLEIYKKTISAECFAIVIGMQAVEEAETSGDGLPGQSRLD